MKIVNVIVGLSLMGTSGLLVAGNLVMPSSPEINVPWSLQTLKDKCNHFSAPAQHEPIYVDLKCERIKRTWKEEEKSVRLCSSESLKAEIYGKRPIHNVEVDPENPGLRRHADLNPITLSCSNYFEVVEIAKKNIEVSCEDVSNWQDISGAVDACGDSEDWSDTEVVDWAEWDDASKRQDPQTRTRQDQHLPKIGLYGVHDC